MVRPLRRPGHASDGAWLRDTRHTWIFRRDARLSHPIAALRLLAIEPAITRRRALLSSTSDAPRLPKNPCATGIQLVAIAGYSASLCLARHPPARTLGGVQLPFLG